MNAPDTQEYSNDSPIFSSKQIVTNDLDKKINNAFIVAMDKLKKNKGTLELVVQTGEAFGRGIFYELYQEKSDNWTIKDWIDNSVDNIFRPLGSSFNLAEISEDRARSLITQYSFYKKEDETNIASFFTYGFIRGLLLSAFPNGELLMGDTLLLDVPLTEYTFLTNASDVDKFERNSIKNLYTKLNKED